MTKEFVTKLQGFYKFEAVDKDTGNRRIVADWFPNLITNSGLNDMGTRNVMQGCMVGSSNTTPNVNDSALGTMVAWTTTVVSSSRSATSAAPYYGKYVVTYRFSPGQATGNLSEVAIGWNENVSGSILYHAFSRALILDSLGNPTTITVLANEYLDVTYELRLYPPLDDMFYQVTLDGVVYDVTVRAATVTSGSGSPSWSPALGPVSNYGWWYAYNGSLGSITANPSGSVSSINSVSTIGYVNNSLTCRAYLSANLDQANLAGGIKSIVYQLNNFGMYQMEFFPAIPKTNKNTFRAEVGVTWARK